jgi:nitrile hydratase accessory protein
MEGMAALPRKSGELVFHDQWERRVFAIAVALCERGLYSWNDFRDRLIIEIATAKRAEQAERTDVTASPLPTYYENWLAALEKLLIEKEICTPEQVKASTAK